MLNTLFCRLLTLVVSGVLLYFIYLFGPADIDSRIVLKKSDGVIALVTSTPYELLSSDAVVAAIEKKLVSEEDSEGYLLSALQKNPSSGRVAASLLYYYSTKEPEKAKEIAELVIRLWPSHTFTRSRLADFWLKEDKLDRVVDEWNILLIRNSRLRKIIFPLLKDVFLKTESKNLVIQFFDSPPPWWDSFFAYLSRELTIDDLSSIYTSRVASVTAVSVVENKYYVNRLMKEKRYREAYEEWFDVLEQRHKSLGGLVYDGGFEGDIINTGFSWSLSRTKNPKIKTDVTYGIKGRKALHVVLRKKDAINFRHVSQRLLLKPNSYELSMRYRLDTLKTTKGLTWRVRCLNKKGAPVIAESEFLSGSKPWTTLKLPFSVPNDCSDQLLRLEAASRFNHDHYFSGSLWFDEINVRVVPNNEK